MQLYAAHQLEVAYLEEKISILMGQRGAAEVPECHPSGRRQGSPWEDGAWGASDTGAPEVTMQSWNDDADENLFEASPIGGPPGPKDETLRRGLLSPSGPPSLEGDWPPSLEGDGISAAPLEDLSDAGHETFSPRQVGPDGGCSDEGRDEKEGEDEDVARASFQPSVRLARSTMSVAQKRQESDEEVELCRGHYMWQWQRTAGGFRNYTPSQNERIEEAYRRGHSKVRFKSGKEGKTPMEIFFVDMIQLDPQSRNIRTVRRLGAKSWHIEWWRHVQATARSVFRGTPRWESFAAYKKRQRGLLGTGQDDEISPWGTSSSVQTGFQRANTVFAQITESRGFVTTSMLFKSLNVIWIGVSVELDEFNQSLWNRHWLSVLLEHIFVAYFSVEVVVQLMSTKCRSLCLCSPWSRLDAVCTAAVVLEVLVVPWIEVTVGSSLVRQILRLTRLAWLLRVLREIEGVATSLRGMVNGMRSAATIWILIFVLLYTCGVLLTATNDHGPDNHGPLDKYFGSMGQTITTLVTYGIALDGLNEFVDDLRIHSGVFQGSVFIIFVFLTYFGLLNMLVGTFCNVAIETAVKEKDLGEIRYLESHLEDIVECYMENGTDRIDSEKFQLVMKNADLLQTLLACGTDTDGLMMLSDILFPHENSSISFEEFFSVIVRLRKGKPVSTSEIIGLQEFTKQRMDGLEELIIQGTDMKRCRSSNTGSVLNSDRMRRMIAHQEEEIHPEQRSQGIREAEKVRKNWIRSFSGDSRDRQRSPWLSPSEP
jgi:hypothetical protein